MIFERLFSHTFQKCEANNDCSGVMVHNCMVDHVPETIHLCSRCTSFTDKSAAQPDTCVAQRSVIPGN